MKHCPTTKGNITSREPPFCLGSNKIGLPLRAIPLARMYHNASDLAIFRLFEREPDIPGNLSRNCIGNEICRIVVPPKKKGSEIK